ncbi:MAG: ABC transporter permease subunit [Dehalococcoidia bacterium]
MNTRAVGAIARKDLREVRSNRSAWAPGIIVPLLFVVVLPVFFSLLPLDTAETRDLRAQLPAPIVERLAGLSDVQAPLVLVLGYVMAPMFLILPLMFSTIIGADSFVGERERRTLEPLLYTPVTDMELFLGKVLASVTPAVLLAWAAFPVYTLVVNVATWRLMGRVWFPLAPWWPLMLWLTPAVATLGMAASVLISSRVSTFRARTSSPARLWCWCWGW